MLLGKNEESLFKVLKDLDTKTKIDLLNKPNQKIHLSAQRTKDGHLTNWIIMEDTTDFKSNKKKTNGKKYNSLIDALNNMDKELISNDEINVLAYCSTDLKRKNGLIVSKWFNISPCIPFELDNKGNPQFNYITLETNEDEYKILMESRLAFYNEFTYDVYPIRKMAFPSIGRLMDCVASFKYISDIPLGSALLIAEKLTKMPKTRFIYRNRTSQIKPLIGVAGSHYVAYSQVEFFKDCFNYLASIGIYTLKSWSVNDELSVVDVIIDDSERNYSIHFKIQTSDIPGTSLSVTAYAQFENAKVYIMKNNSYHGKAFEQRGGAKSLFDGMEEAIEEFKEQYRLLSNNYLEFDESMIDEIEKIIGKKNMAKVELPEQFIVSGSDLFRQILKSTFFNLKEKQAYELTKYYRNLMCNLCDYIESDKKEA